MNCLKVDKQIAVVSALVEGASIRSIERMTGVNRNTVMSLLVRTGQYCEKLLNTTMTGIECQNVQADEIWCYVSKKQGHLTQEERESQSDIGDQYVYVAMDADTKVVPVYVIGKRTYETTLSFVLNLSRRVKGSFQLTTDAFHSYAPTIETVYRGTGVYPIFWTVRCVAIDGVAGFDFV